MEKRSLGLIETWGFVPAIEAADVGAKAANVVLLGYEVVPVGRVVVTFMGDVAAVKAAVQSGAAAAEKVGQVLATHVIPRPDRQIRVEPPSEPLLPKKKPDPDKPPKPPPPDREESIEGEESDSESAQKSEGDEVDESELQKTKTAKKRPKPPAKSKKESEKAEGSDGAQEGPEEEGADS